MSKVSVIVPVYNAEKYLREAIESVLNQTYTDFELLLINDRSTDKSREICEEYSKKDERIILLENDTENHGPGPTRNIGLDNATGDFIYFMDADDWIDKTLLETCIDRMRETNADIVQVGVEYVWNDGKGLFKQYHNGNCLITREDIKKDFLKFWNENSIMLWQQFFKRETIRGIRFENIMNGEDVCYVADALFNTLVIAYVQKALYHYRCIEGSTCHRWVEDTIESLEKQFNHQKKYLNSFNGKIEKTAYSLLAYGCYMWEIYQLTAYFCPLSYNEKKEKLLMLRYKIDFDEYRDAYPLKLQHGLMKIKYALVKYRLENIIILFYPIFSKLIRKA